MFLLIPKNEKSQETEKNYNRYNKEIIILFPKIFEIKN